ncbi:MAG TPA: TIGR04295 family B12-binding domain-containing radical SAM protein [Chloroflexota bacterium]|nr:TIGR04295 family B12-binding domain-containing radical SAM protein [Chloroflexota bacterium]
MSDTALSAKRVALVNPRWDFSESRYWACTETHLPLELLYSQALLEAEGIETLVVDAHLEDLSPNELAARVGEFQPGFIVLTTAPSYLFWRCCPPELDVPAVASALLQHVAPVVAIGPHGSATPGYVLEQLACAAVVRGEPEEELVRLARESPTTATVFRDMGGSQPPSKPAVVDVSRLPALDYSQYPLEKRVHRHHIFWGEGKGAEAEFSRGCPYGCNFCNRRFFRGSYRERPVEVVLSEMRALRDRGVDYVYFIDEIFGLGRCSALLEALARDPFMQFGCETRIDLWDEARLDTLAAAGCVSVEFGLESPFPDVQTSLNKGYRINGDRILEILTYAKGRIPWVQGDMMEAPDSSEELQLRTEEWRQEAISRGVWVSEPIRAFLYPGCDLHDQLIGPLEDNSWHRARDRSG